MTANKFKAGVWSAAPTPLLHDGQIDIESITRLTQHHIRLGVQGVFLCGTSGEGPWLSDRKIAEVVEATVAAAAGKLKITVQVTDNSSERVLDNIDGLVDSGVDAVIVAPPYFQQNPDQPYLKRLITEILDNSSLPVGFYHRGSYSSVEFAPETVSELMAHPNLVMVKDSSSDPKARELFVQTAAKLEQPPLLLNGDEFNAVPYLEAGYDGMLFGGACFNGYISNSIIAAARAGDLAEAQRIQERMAAMMIKIFGGEGFPYWLAAQKQLLVELGIFSTNTTVINYQMPSEHIEVLRKVIDEHRSELLP